MTYEEELRAVRFVSEVWSVPTVDFDIDAFAATEW